MFARVQTIYESAEKLDELTKIAQEQLPASHELSGFTGFYYLVSRDQGKALVISLWETEQDLSRLDTHPTHIAARDRAEADAVVTSPPTEIFEVSLQAS